MENKEEPQNPKPVIPSVEHNYGGYEAPASSPETMHKATNEGVPVFKWILLPLILIILITWLLFLT